MASSTGSSSKVEGKAESWRLRGPGSQQPPLPLEGQDGSSLPSGFPTWHRPSQAHVPRRTREAFRMGRKDGWGAEVVAIMWAGDSKGLRSFPKSIPHPV